MLRADNDRSLYNFSTIKKRPIAGRFFIMYIAASS